MNNKTLKLFCDHCNWKKTTDIEGLKELFEIKQSRVQGHIPVLDAETRSVKTSPDYAPKKKYRCPSCGYAVTPKVVADVQKDIDDMIKDKMNKLEQDKITEISQLRKQ